MPGLAFDVTLNRIGYGGGFYDRYLVKNGDRYYKTAICFDYQVLDDIPAEEFDIIIPRRPCKSLITSPILSLGTKTSTS